MHKDHVTRSGGVSVICLSLALTWGLAAEPVAAGTVERFKKHVEYLSSDELEGRAAGSRGIAEAASYIAIEFEQIGLIPLPHGEYYQSFPLAGQALAERNVIGWLRASTPTDKSILVTAHYDGLGLALEGQGRDRIYNGARDNATGVAALIELGRVFAQRKELSHNLVFIATAAEELAMDGGRYYIDNPVFPLDQVTISLNIDGFNVTGPRGDFFMLPRQGVSFEQDISEVAAGMGWRYAPPNWVDSMNTKFDSAAFLAEGVPAVTIWTGDTLKDGRPAPQLSLGGIHSVDDEVNDHWNWLGVEDHFNLYLGVADFYLERPGRAKVTDTELFEVGDDGDS